MECASIKGLAVILPWIWWMYKFLICGELAYIIPIALFCYLIKLLEDEQKRYVALLMRENTEEKNKMDKFSQTEDTLITDESVQTYPAIQMINKETQCNWENTTKANASCQTDEIPTKDEVLEIYQGINISNKDTQYDWEKQTKIDAVPQTDNTITEDQAKQAISEIGTEILSQTTNITELDKYIQPPEDTNTSNKEILPQTAPSRTYTCLLYHPIGHDGEPRRQLKEKIQFKPTFRTIKEIEKDTILNKASIESKNSDTIKQDRSLRVIHFAGKEIRYKVKSSPPPKLSPIFEVQEIISNTSKEKMINKEMSTQSLNPAPSRNKDVPDPNPGDISIELKKEMNEKREKIPYFRRKFRKLKNRFLKK